MTGREHGPAVGAAFGDEERLARTKQVQHGQIVDAAARALRESEAGRGTLHEIAILYTYQLALAVVIRYLQPRYALLISPRRQPTPPNHSRIQPTLLKQKLPSLVVQPRALEEALVA